MNPILRKQTIGFIQQQPSSWTLGHVQTVAKIALELAENYPKADKEVIEMGALLHDVGHTALADIKKENDHHLESKKKAEKKKVKKEKKETKKKTVKKK